MDDVIKNILLYSLITYKETIKYIDKEIEKRVRKMKKMNFAAKMAVLAVSATMIAGFGSTAIVCAQSLCQFRFS